MTTPMEILSREHRIIESVLRALDGICARLEQGETIPAETCAEIVDFIRAFADGFHHEKEEQHLFPMLEACGVPREGGPLGVMLYEHEVGRHLVAQMHQAAQEYARHEARAAGDFVATARQYIELLGVHIYKEDNVLFRISESVLSGEALNSLNQSFEEVALDFGADTYAKYEQFALKLEKIWARQAQQSL